METLALSLELGREDLFATWNPGLPLYLLNDVHPQHGKAAWTVWLACPSYDRMWESEPWAGGSGRGEYLWLLSHPLCACALHLTAHLFSCFLIGTSQHPMRWAGQCLAKACQWLREGLPTTLHIPCLPDACGQRGVSQDKASSYILEAVSQAYSCSRGGAKGDWVTPGSFLAWSFSPVSESLLGCAS